MHKVIQNKLTKSIIILPIFGIIILSFLYINIYVNNALMNSSAITGSHALVVSDEPLLSIGLTPSIDKISISPTAEGAFDTQSVDITVNSTDNNGYFLSMAASTSSLSRSDAVQVSIPTLPGSTDASSNPYTCTKQTAASCNFPVNTWGFMRSSASESFTDTGYQPMRGDGYNIPIRTMNGITGNAGDTSTVTFGVKLDQDIPSGEYSINIDFIAINNVAPNLAYMQDATSTSLAAAMPNVHDTAVLYDRRDGQEYTVAKLKDGKYWMTKNLNLAGGTVLTSEDTDMASDWVLPAANGFQEGNKLPESSNTGTAFSDSSQAYVFNSNSTDCTQAPGCYSYYSITAATLGSDYTFQNDELAPYSICPKGWKLPTSSSSGSSLYQSTVAYQFAIAYGMDNDSRLPESNIGPGSIPNFTYAGYYNGTTLTDNGIGAIYATSSGYVNSNGIYGRDMTYHTSNGRFHPYNAYSGNRGTSVRCLFDATMQNFSQEDAAAMAEHQVETLVDARDGQNYTVAKLKDGNVWMTQNLDFDITGDTLSSTTTNLVAYGSEPYTSDKGYSQDSATGEITWTPISTGATIITGRDKTGTNGEINYGTNAGKWENNNNNPYSVDPGEWYQSGIYFASSVCNDAAWSTGCNFLNSAKNTAQDGVTALTTYFRQTPYADNGTHGAIGNYYNWSAAVAANDTSGYNTGTLTNSVCPAGWGLPANGKYGTINTNYNSNAASGTLDAGLFAAPLYFVRGGEIYTSGTTTLYDAGRFGGYWSGTTDSADRSYNLDVRSSYVNPAYGSYRGLGYSVRCLLRTE
ncbi:hypothetical protein IKG68_01880 [Candidatus Saccharibacteria bacterium]|nr:hypothetical protein [Candidatus Saccharibacteria bacterium]